ncbi:type III secretion system export apparatus subunit SctT [Herbaspirillum sp. RTI4]|uniref:type III secretion system export apparatus subunit SctT n=1 Tax=Herbaspirillum sp. RTI4 TaxID=3048640 RepID=UPI002AB5AEA0|nr:type III secretion system export apparatus subunit SctT [Herbaspirillum sp. RTI4]MDY7578373.1 type III secretion system export apparatus subunit SctT [Herbaspirillum sp. RTI4]MEA9983511.1 type III secretion system export apparatus subunit SctT [Herbaspirillum sp. RTI4]
MSMMAFLNEISQAWGGVMLAFARISVCFYILPFLNKSVLIGAAARNSVIVIVIVGIWPMIAAPLPALDAIDLLFLGLKEALVGLGMGMVLAMPFWVFHAMGAWIDNQRGATISSSIDPLNGIDSTEMSNFLHLFCIVIFLENGGMLNVIEAISDSYRLVGLLEWNGIDFNKCVQVIPRLISKSLSLSAPILLVLFLSEILLGILSRFTPQLNAFSISLGIKSVIALTVLLMYFVPLLSVQIVELGRAGVAVELFNGVQ